MPSAQTSVLDTVPKLRPRKPGALPAEQRGALPAKEAAAYIGCGVATLYRLIGRGELHPIKIGRSTVFMVDDLRALLDRAKTPGAVVMSGGAA